MIQDIAIIAAFGEHRGDVFEGELHPPQPHDDPRLFDLAVS